MDVVCNLDDFAKNTEIVAEGLNRRIFLPKLLWNAVLSDGKAYLDGADYIRKYIRDVVEKRRAEDEADEDDKKDLMSAMFKAKEDDEAPMSDDEILDETIMFFLAGHETSSNTLCWTLLGLCNNPEALRKCTEEVDRVLEGREPEWEDLHKLKYMDAVLKESLRFYNTAPVTGRLTTKDVEFKGSVIPKGTQLMVFIQGTHMDSDYFKEPEKFMPERWEADDASHLPFLAFGYGARMCIGRKFAWTEMQVVLARILQNFTLELAPDQTIKAVHSVTKGPKAGIKIVFNPRV
jgi:cytochrome P450